MSTEFRQAIEDLHAQAWEELIAGEGITVEIAMAAGCKFAFTPEGNIALVNAGRCKWHQLGIIREEQITVDTREGWRSRTVRVGEDTARDSIAREGAPGSDGRIEALRRFYGSVAVQGANRSPYRVKRTDIAAHWASLLSQRDQSRYTGGISPENPENEQD